MASISETGHVKNVANFRVLLSFCEGYGESYNPAKESLRLEELQLLLAVATKQLNEVSMAKIRLDYAIQTRKQAFEGLRPFVTRVVNAFAVSGVDGYAIVNARGILRRFHGVRSKDKSGADSGKRISVSQQSFDRLMGHFASLIALLEEHPIYMPNEIELQVSSLKAKLLGLRASNSALLESATFYSNALITRNVVLYDSAEGLLCKVSEIKKYIKSVFGASSRQYKQVTALVFKR